MEAKQILTILQGNAKSNAWQNHPAVRMWRGYEDCLGNYYNCILEEWIKRGYNNNMPYMPWRLNCKLPCWFGYEPFFASHRSNLLRKDPVFYGKYGWSEPNNLEYVWPL